MQRSNRFAEMYTWAWAGVAGVMRIVLNMLRLHNFAPVGPVSLFAGSRISLVRALLTSLGMMVVTDLLLYVGSGFDSRFSIFQTSRPIVYASFMIYVVIGWTLVGKSSAVWRIGLAAALGEAQFFLITNFATWADGVLYNRDLAGLALCYSNAFEFAKWPLAAEPLFVVAIFGVYALLPKPREESAAVGVASAELEVARTR